MTTINIKLEEKLQQKIEESLRTQKNLRGLTESKFLKYYNLNKDNPEFKYKKSFENYINITNIVSLAIKRKKFIKFSLLPIVILFLNFFILIFASITLSVPLVLLSVFIFFLVLVLIIIQVIKLIQFLKYKNNNFFKKQ